MKAILSAATIAALVVGASGLQAAEQKKPLKKTTKSAPVTKKILKAKAKKVAVSPWSFGAIFENEFAGQSFYDGGVRTGTTNVYLRANYKLNSQTSFRIEQQLQQQYEDAERTKASVGYTYLQIAQTAAYRIGPQKLDYYLRAYLPTNVDTREQNNQYLELRGDVSTKILSAKNFSMKLHFQGRYYAAEKFQDPTLQTVSVNGVDVQNIGNLNGQGDLNNDLRIRPYVATSWDFATKFNYYQQLGYQRTWKKDGSGGDTNLYAYGEVGYQVTNAIGVQLGGYALRPIEEALGALYRPSDSYYYLNASLNF